MKTILKRQIEGHLKRTRQWIDISKKHCLPLNCLRMAEIQLEAIEILLTHKHDRINTNPNKFGFGKSWRY